MKQLLSKKAIKSPQGRRLLSSKKSSATSRVQAPNKGPVQVGKPIVHTNRKPLIIKRQHVEEIVKLIPSLSILSLKEFDALGDKPAGINVVIQNKNPFKIVNTSDESVHGFEYIILPTKQVYLPAYNYVFPIYINTIEGSIISLDFYRVDYTETPVLWLKGINNLRRHLRFVLLEISQEGVYFKS